MKPADLHDAIEDALERHAQRPWWRRGRSVLRSNVPFIQIGGRQWTGRRDDKGSYVFTRRQAREILSHLDFAMAASYDAETIRLLTGLAEPY